MKPLLAIAVVYLLASLCPAATLQDRMSTVNHLLPWRSPMVEPGRTVDVSTRRTLVGLYAFDSGGSGISTPATRSSTATLSNSLGL